MWPLTPIAITSRRLHQCRPLKNVNSIVHSIFHSIFHSPFQSIFQSSYSTSTIILPDQSLSASVSPEQHKHLAQMSKRTRCTWVLFHHFGINMSAMESNLSTSLSWTNLLSLYGCKRKTSCREKIQRISLKYSSYCSKIYLKVGRTLQSLLKMKMTSEHFSCLAILTLC